MEATFSRKDLTYGELRRLVNKGPYKTNIIEFGKDEEIYRENTGYNNACKLADWTEEWFNQWDFVRQVIAN